MPTRCFAFKWGNGSSPATHGRKHEQKAEGAIVRSGKKKSNKPLTLWQQRKLNNLFCRLTLTGSNWVEICLWGNSTMASGLEKVTLAATFQRELVQVQ